MEHQDSPAPATAATPGASESSASDSPVFSTSCRLNESAELSVETRGERAADGRERFVLEARCTRPNIFTTADLRAVGTAIDEALRRIDVVRRTGNSATMRFELTDDELAILSNGGDIARAGNVTLFGRPTALVIEVNGPQPGAERRKDIAAGIAPAVPDAFWMHPPTAEIEGGRRTVYNRPTRASALVWMRRIAEWQYAADDQRATARLIARDLEALDVLKLHIATAPGEIVAGDGAVLFLPGYVKDGRAKLLILSGRKKVRYLIGPWRLEQDPDDRLALLPIDGPIEAVGDIVTSARTRAPYPTMEELRAWLQDIREFSISTPRARNNSTALLQMLDELETAAKAAATHPVDFLATQSLKALETRELTAAEVEAQFTRDVAPVLVDAIKEKAEIARRPGSGRLSFEAFKERFGPAILEAQKVDRIVNGIVKLEAPIAVELPSGSIYQAGERKLEPGEMADVIVRRLGDPGAIFGGLAVELSPAFGAIIRELGISDETIVRMVSARVDELVDGASRTLAGFRDCDSSGNGIPDEEC